MLERSSRWPIERDIHWAVAGSLIGLSIPYIFFMILAFGELKMDCVANCGDRGQGLGLAAPFFLIPEGILAVLGWFIGDLARGVASFLRRSR